MLGDCDQGVTRLARALGWGDHLDTLLGGQPGGKEGQEGQEKKKEETKEKKEVENDGEKSKIKKGKTKAKQI